MHADAGAHIATQIGPALGAWWLSYLVHSTILLLVVWFITSRLSDRFDALKQTMWRVALYGGLITATLQAFVGFRPVAGHLVSLDPPVVASTPAPASGNASGGWGSVLDAPVEQSATASIAPVADNDQRAGASAPSAFASSALSEESDLQATRSTHAAVASTPVAAVDTAAAATDSPTSWLTVLAFVAIVCATGGLLIVLHRYIATQRALRRRVRVVDPRWLCVLDELRITAGVRRRVTLSASRSLATPAAFGVLHPEICLPMRASVHLTVDEARAMLAHELAHLVRHDPLWLIVDHIVAALFCVQPLNSVARRHLAETAEYQCDRWAARRLGDGLTLAGCLTRVAGWLIADRRGQAPAMVAAMAMPRSPLARRIHRLLDLRAGRDMAAGRRAALALALAVVVAVIAPAGWTSAPSHEASAAGVVEPVSAVATALPASLAIHLPVTPQAAAPIIDVASKAQAASPAPAVVDLPPAPLPAPPATAEAPVGPPDALLPELMAMLDVELGELEQLATQTTNELKQGGDADALLAAQQLADRIERVKQKRRDLDALLCPPPRVPGFPPR